MNIDVNKLTRLLVVFLLLTSAISSQAGATNYSLWINGRGDGGAAGHYDDFKYWGPPRTDIGVNPKAVNWDGYNSIASQNGKVRDALDCFCTGTNWCYIATFSAGDPMMGYTLANFGGSTRQVRNAAANGDGVCGRTGSVQTGWNIHWVRAAAGAAGGTELSDTGRWTTGEPLVHDLKTTTVRAMYNHNDTRGIWFYLYAGARGTLYSFVLPGQDDEVVAYHSSGGVSGSSGASYCNPRDWWCNDLTLGAAVNEGGWPKWTNHYLQYRDDGENFKHYINSNWGGITTPMRADMEAYAK